MAIAGLKLITLALRDKETGELLKGDAGLSADGLFPVTTAMLGSKSANITNISVAGQPVYGNNTKVDQTQAKGEPSVALDFNDLPFNIKQKLLGRISDGKGGFQQGDRPRVAMTLETQTLNRKNSIWFGFANGEVQETAANLQTDTNNEVRVDDALTFTSFGVEEWNNEAMKVYSDIDAKFDKSAMQADVFGATVAPAPATPSV
ncbi:phage tail protein [Weissella confusa]|uniref:phage tail protein n=1 Tax=Weissella confusa TaxID=1583 RepID=UPI0018F15659|nr:phage tail protein [Weissella confusa]MBJ7619260.1 phage tail protein [Weissella confusa]MBJ7666595.1 phage tail protein [Weissella confusa]MCT0005042.1 phage tail protein [Weissella confusa]MCT0018731.1 phage tail protein [Weissella confusa]MCT0039384.1 phage tail protein [Weissella confusa]